MHHVSVQFPLLFPFPFSFCFCPISFLSSTLFLNNLLCSPSVFDTSQPAVVFICLDLYDEERQTLQRK